MEPGEYRVGELAQRAGVTVRTLHHWEEVGLLTPKRRTQSGHRIYGLEAVERLQRIRSMKALGLGLEEIRSTLFEGTSSLESVLLAHREEVRTQLRMLSELQERLDHALSLLESQEEVPEEELLETMKWMTAMDQHFPPEQRDYLKARAETLGQEAIQDAQMEWPRLINRLTEEMEKGTDPGNPEVQRLATRWKELVEAFSGGDKEIERSLAGMYQAEPGLAEGQGLSGDLFAYLREAWQTGP